ncbi:MAG: membrane dipeptidase [Anaerolineales bacterium]|nr:membrane dipeptidase [Anaerolineales bacterium]
MNTSYPLIIVDAHQDIGYNYMEDGRDFLKPALVKRQFEDNSPDAVKGRGIVTCSLPEALMGRVGIIFATLYASPKFSPMPAKFSYETPREAYQIGMAQLDYYKRLLDNDSRLALIHDQSSMQQVLATWAAGTEFIDRKLGLVILMEGADPVIEPRQAEEWYEQGVRIIGPAWSETRYSGGTGRPGPLTPLGFELLQVMSSLGMILDLSHMAEKAYLQAVDHYAGVVIASHSNPRHFVDRDRMLSDEMILRLAERGGVMGLVPFNRFMLSGWTYGTNTKEQVTIDHFIDMIDYVCQLTGSVRHVGIGTDWDGGFGAESIPTPFDTIADLWLLHDALQGRGFEADDIQAILGGNFLRILSEGL